MSPGDLEGAPSPQAKYQREESCTKGELSASQKSLPHGIRHVREHILGNWTSLSKDSPEGLEETITCLTQNHKEFLFSKTLGENSIFIGAVSVLSKH